MKTAASSQRYSVCNLRIAMKDTCKNVLIYKDDLEKVQNLDICT